MGSLITMILLLAIVKFMVSEAFCPVKCDCSKKDLLYCQDQSIKDLAELDFPHNFSFVHISGTQVDKVTNDSFQQMPITLRLNLESNQLSTVFPGAFQDFPLLKSLKLSTNHLDSLPPGVFDTLTDLEQLFLDRNVLSSLDPHLFKNLKNLTELILNRNRLTGLSHEIFTHQVNLKILNLSKNRLSTLPNDIFSSLHVLTSLMLYENFLTEITDSHFLNLCELVKLTLNSNRIKKIDEKAFYHVPNLRELSLHRNYLQTLPEGLFLHVNKLEKLFLFENPLIELPDILFGQMDSLRSLWLYKTLLTTIPNFIFSNLTNLEILILTRNQHLHGLPSESFSGLSRLVELSLHTNNITSLPEEIFQNLPSLHTLSLHSNNLQGLPENLFKPLRNLEIVYLNNSKITTLPGDIFRSVPTLQRVHLDGNPWMCDCRLQEFKLWLRLNTEKVFNSTALVCQNPSSLAGIPLLNVSELTCPFSTVNKVDYYVSSTSSSWNGFTSMATPREEEDPTVSAYVVNGTDIPMTDPSWDSAYSSSPSLPSNMDTNTGSTSMPNPGEETDSTVSAYDVNGTDIPMTDPSWDSAYSSSPSLPSKMDKTTERIVFYNFSRNFHTNRYFNYYLPCGKIMYFVVYVNLAMQVFYILVTCLTLLKIRKLYKYFQAFTKPVVLIRMLIPLNSLSVSSMK